MKDVVIFGKNFVTLTVNSPLSKNGIPVLRVDFGDFAGDFTPDRLIGQPPNAFLAAGVVQGWIVQPERTPEEIEAGRLFLSSWPNQTQIVEADNAITH